VTLDGKTLTGRLLNHDSYSVQFIESSGQLESVKKARLREFTIVTTNPMPSYADKMSADDLNTLVHYLERVSKTPPKRNPEAGEIEEDEESSQ
jgi:hypothetical protein